VGRPFVVAQEAANNNFRRPSRKGTGMSRGPSNINPKTNKPWTPQERAAVPKIIPKKDMPTSFMDRTNKGGLAGQVSGPDDGFDPYSKANRKITPINQVKKTLGMAHAIKPGKPPTQPSQTPVQAGKIPTKVGATPPKPGLMGKMGLSKPGQKK
jgi:hypothetical protein